jgi:hypothetical protein
MSQASFQKRQREKARQERAAAKSAKRSERTAAEAPAPTTPTRDQATVLAELAALHERFAAGEIDFEAFETAKQQLVDDLDVG